MTALNPTKAEKSMCALMGHRFITLANSRMTGEDCRWCERCGYETSSRKYMPTKAWNDYMNNHGPVVVEGVKMDIPMFLYRAQYER